MSLVLCTREEEMSSLAHGIVLCTQEEADQYLMHYRVGGEKKGHRRWQDPSGRLTPEGYKHYAEMYGWNKKVQKAENLQNKADKKSESAQNAVRRSEEAIVKAYNAKQKNERRPSDRNQAKFDKLNTESEKRKVAASQANLDAMKAQKKAVDYADKLQRKEDKMSKYVDENGKLTEEAINKYAYATPNPGEKRMSLLGRIKFGNEYSNKFNNENKMKMTKEEYKEWEKDETRKFNEYDKTIEEFNGNEKHDSALLNISDDTIKEHIQADRDWYNDEQYDSKEDRVASLKYFTENTKKYQDLARKNVGDDVLIYLTDPKSDKSDDYNDIQSWLFKEIDDKSGNWNVGEFRKGTKGSAAYDKLSEEYDKENTRREEIEKEINYKPAKYTKAENMQALPLTSMVISNKRGKQRDSEYKRLQQALKGDSIYQALKENSRVSESNLCGAVLKDLGFRDTPENRSLIFSYIFYD